MSTTATTEKKRVSTDEVQDSDSRFVRHLIEQKQILKSDLKAITSIIRLARKKPELEKLMKFTRESEPAPKL